MDLELWTLTHSNPDHVEGAARRAEAAGWDGMAVVDSQNLAGDSYVALTLAAKATQKLRLGTGVTNSVTRHPSVTASAALAVQSASNGRMVIGIGRGDSALAHLGRSPARLGPFERYVDVLQRYLRGEEVPFALLPMEDRIAAPVDALNLADHPTSSRIRWAKGLPKVPVEVAATGPKVIAMSARLADRVVFTLGAVPERIAWGIELAREARRRAGLDPNALRIGAYVNLVCHPDAATARALVKGGLTTFARFSVMHGDAAGPLSAADEHTLARLHDGYDMTQHTRADSSQARLLSDDFIDRFAIAGDVDHCMRRLAELRALGIDKVIVSGPSAGADREEGRRAMARADDALLPALRGL